MKPAASSHYRIIRFSVVRREARESVESVGVMAEQEFEGHPVDFVRARADLLARIRRDVRDERVLQAMDQVPREEFVPPRLRHLAYDDAALPIGEDQTISQPTIVALMTAVLELQGDEKVLEVGTGSGYQAAVLSLLCREVVSVERKQELADAASRRLWDLGYRKVAVHVARDGLGYPDSAPYDAIIVTAAAPNVPKELLEQLRDRGRIVIPVGFPHEQRLLQVTKQGADMAVRDLGACRFVPLIGPSAWTDVPPV